MHQPALANLSSYNGWLPSWLGRTQISVKFIAFYNIVFYFHLFSCQSRDKMLHRLYRNLYCTHDGSQPFWKTNSHYHIHLIVDPDNLAIPTHGMVNLTIKFRYYKQKYSSMPSFTYNSSQPIYSLTIYSCPPNEWQVDTKD